jgi:UPF0271 protein
VFPPVLLNIDAGESPEEPEALYGVAQIVNVACGGHAGDDASMDRVLRACVRFGTRAGAHPSYEDRAGFGRRALAIAPGDLAASVARQIARLVDRARDGGVVVRTVKPHGALYHAADHDSALARAVVQGSVEALGRDLLLIGPPNGELRRAAGEAGIGYLREGFADRGTLADGSLIPRGAPGALISDPAIARARARALALSGDVDTVCVHGDTPGATLIAHATREALDALAAG